MARQWYWPDADSETGWKVWGYDDPLESLVFPEGFPAFHPAFMNQFVSWWCYLFGGYTGDPPFWGGGRYVSSAGIFETSGNLSFLGKFAGASQTATGLWSINPSNSGYSILGRWFNLPASQMQDGGIVSSETLGSAATATIPSLAGGTVIQMNTLGIRTALRNLRRALDAFTMIGISQGFDGTSPRRIQRKTGWHTTTTTEHTATDPALVNWANPTGEYTYDEYRHTWHETTEDLLVDDFGNFGGHSFWARRAWVHTAGSYDETSQTWKNITWDCVSSIPYMYYFRDNIRHFDRIAVAYAHRWDYHGGYSECTAHYAGNATITPSVSDGVQIVHIGQPGSARLGNNYYVTITIPSEKRFQAVESPAEPTLQYSCAERCTLYPCFFGLPSNDIPPAAYRPSSYGLPEVPYQTA